MSLSIKELQFEINEHLDKCLSLDKTPRSRKATLYATLIQHLEDKLKAEVEYLQDIVDVHKCKMDVKGYCECVALIRRIKVVYGSLK